MAEASQADIDLGALGFERRLTEEERRAIAAQSRRLHVALAARRADLFEVEPALFGLWLLRGAEGRRTGQARGR